MHYNTITSLQAPVSEVAKLALFHISNTALGTNRETRVSLFFCNLRWRGTTSCSQCDWHSLRASSPSANHISCCLRQSRQLVFYSQVVVLTLNSGCADMVVVYCSTFAGLCYKVSARVCDLESRCTSTFGSGYQERNKSFSLFL